MAKLKKIAYPADNGQSIYVSKKIIDYLYKKTIVTCMQTVGGAGGKVVIEYEAKKGSAHGRMELYDMGSDD